jgi:hypothetical protein
VDKEAMRNIVIQIAMRLQMRLNEHQQLHIVKICRVLPSRNQMEKV